MPPDPPAQARSAATVVLLRERAGVLETLLLRRNARLGFFPHAWVFPGGRVDEADHTVAAGGGGPRLTGAVPGLSTDRTAFAVAAARECFEEAGVWLGEVDPPTVLRDRLNAREATLLDAPPESVLELSRMRLWAHWITPEIEPRRYDTLFFVVAVTPDEARGASHDAGETVGSAWVSVAEAAVRAEPEQFFIAPPTFRTLEEMAALGSLDAVFAAAPTAAPPPVMPRLDQSAGSWTIVLPGDPTHPSDNPVAGPSRIVWRETRWRSEHAP